MVRIPCRPTLKAAQDPQYHDNKKPPPIEKENAPLLSNNVFRTPLYVHEPRWQSSVGWSQLSFAKTEAGMMAVLRGGRWKNKAAHRLNCTKWIIIVHRMIILCLWRFTPQPWKINMISVIWYFSRSACLLKLKDSWPRFVSRLFCRYAAHPSSTCPTGVDGTTSSNITVLWIHMDLYPKKKRTNFNSFVGRGLPMIKYHDGLEVSLQVLENLNDLNILLA